MWVQRAFEQFSELLTTVLNLSSLFFFVDSTTVALHDAQLKIILICLLLHLDVALSLKQAVSVSQFDKAVTDDRKSGKASRVMIFEYADAKDDNEKHSPVYLNQLNH